MSDQRIPISQLSETQTAPDASYIAIDDGSLTKKITVENFNSTSTASAQQYASQAAASAQTVEDNIATSAAQIREATLAAREATQASTAATASATSAYDSASLAQNYSANASTSAGQAMNAADSSAQNLTASKGYAEDSEAWAVGKRNGTDIPASDETYQNNAKYYSGNADAQANAAYESAVRAETAAQSINEPDETLSLSGIASDSKVVGDMFTTTGAMGDIINKVFGGNVCLPTTSGMIFISNSDVGECTINKIGNTYCVNGNLTTNNTRIPLTGTGLGYTSAQPTYERRPLWYVDDIPDFIVGHDYVATFYAEGEKTAEDMTFTMRTKDGSYGRSYYFGDIITCAVKPEMVCVILKPGEYTNYRFSVFLTDLTATGGKYYVPNIFESQLNTAISKIKADINSTKTVGTYGTDIESFVFITDVHWAANKKHSPGMIKRILEETSIETVICGGDIIQYHADSKEAACAEVKDFINTITQIPCRDYFSVFGNHDDNAISNSGNISEMLTKAEQYNLLYSPFVNSANVHWIWEDVPAVFTETVTKNDYYIDHSRTRTRFICLDWNNPVSSNRSAWVTDILSRNDGYRVVIIYHGFYAGGELTPEHVSWLPVFEPYKSKIVAMFTGHAHVDGVVDCYGDGSTPVIVTSCDTFRADRMTEGTLDEQCFDVVVIDYTNSKIELTRIGRGSNRTVEFSLS